MSMLDAALSAGCLRALVEELTETVEDEHLWSIWLTGVSDLGFDEWKRELKEKARIKQIIAQTNTDDVIADSMAIAKSMLREEA